VLAIWQRDLVLSKISMSGSIESRSIGQGEHMSADFNKAWLSGSKRNRKSKLDSLIKLLAPSEIIEIDNTSSVRDLDEAVNDGDMFSGSRLVIVKGMPEMESTRPKYVKEIKKIVDRIPDGCFLLFYGIEPSDEKAISDHIKKLDGKILAFGREGNRSEAKAEFGAVLSEFGKYSDDENAIGVAIDLLPSEKGQYNLDLVALEAEKFALWLGRIKKFDTENIRFVLESLDTGLWDFLDTLDSQDFKRIYTDAQNLIKQDKYGVSTAIPKILSICLNKFRLLMFLSESTSTGNTQAQAIDAACGLTSLTVKGLVEGRRIESVSKAYQSYRVAKMFDPPNPPLKAYSRGTLKNCVDCLQRLLECCRSFNNDAQHKMAMDTFLLLLCGNISGQSYSMTMRYLEEFNPE
jgi:hypothetical protein